MYHYHANQIKNMMQDYVIHHVIVVLMVLVQFVGEHAQVVHSNAEPYVWLMVVTVQVKS